MKEIFSGYLLQVFFSRQAGQFVVVGQYEKLSISGNRPSQRLTLIFRANDDSGKEMIA